MEIAVFLKVRGSKKKNYLWDTFHSESIENKAIKVSTNYAAYINYNVSPSLFKEKDAKSRMYVSTLDFEYIREREYFINNTKKNYISALSGTKITFVVF